MLRAMVVVALTVTSVACAPSGNGAAARVADSAASRVPPVRITTSTFPSVGVAVMDSASAWCAEFPATAPALALGTRVTIVFAAPIGSPAASAKVVRRRERMCHTEFNQPRWDDYVGYDLALGDTVQQAGVDIPTATLAVASDARWVRGTDGVARSDLDGDGVPEEAHVCRADEGEHFTLWSAAPGGRRRLRAHEYFDWGALVDPTCGAEVTTDSAGSDATPSASADASPGER